MDPSITLDYKRGDEYKAWYSRIKQENPTMPDLLVDYAIAFHKANPRAYKDRGCNNCPENVMEFRRKWAELQRNKFTLSGAVQVREPEVKADAVFSGY